MKLVTILSILLISLASKARDIVLLSGFEPFGGARSNNSWVIAETIQKRFENHPNLEIHTCLLPTTFEGAFPKLDECFNQLPKAPIMVLSLGEGPCELNLETQVYNMDSNPRRRFGRGPSPDNAGVRRNRQPIIPGAPFNVGLRLDVASLYCSLNQTERDFVIASATPGNFVCNNAAYQFTSAHPEVPFSFAHVTSQSCKKNQESKRKLNIDILEKVIIKNLELTNSTPLNAPHASNLLRLPTNKADVIDQMRDEVGCKKKFWGKLLKDQIN